VIAFGTPLVDDPARIGTVTALGVDEILFVKRGEYRTQTWATQLVDVRTGQVIDVVEGRDTARVGAWFDRQSKTWRAAISHATLDLSGTYRAMLDRYLGHAIQIADPFHVVRVANTALDDCRRRVQNETLGHRAANTTRSTGPAAGCRRHRNGSPLTAKRNFSGCSKPATRKAT
jgi:transposase